MQYQNELIMEKLAKLVGMNVIYGIHKGCLIGLIKGINGICIANENRGIVAHGIPTVKHAKEFINKRF